MDYEFMRHITDVQIKKEIDARIAQDALREKARQDKRDRRDAVILITAFIVCVLAVGFLGG